MAAMPIRIVLVSVLAMPIMIIVVAVLVVIPV